jgi:hypothetical protein
MCVCVKGTIRQQTCPFFHKVFHELSLLYTLFDMYVVSKFYQYWALQGFCSQIPEVGPLAKIPSIN